jgi:hypothetical protein
MSDAIMKAVLGRDFQADPAAMADYLLCSEALADVIGERLDQVFKHGFGGDHDRSHGPAILPLAALTYLNDAIDKLNGMGIAGPVDGLSAPISWPFVDMFRPADARINLVKTAALLIAAIDRLDNAEPDAPPAPDPDQGATHDEGSRGEGKSAMDPAIAAIFGAQP